MKRLLSVLAFAAVLAFPAAAQSFLRIELPAEDPLQVSNMMEPVLIEGVCSPDVVSVSVEYRFTPQDNEKADAQQLKLIETYQLKKFVAGSGRFLYRAFPSLGNIGCGANQFTVVGLTKSGAKVSDVATVMSYQYFGEKAKPVIYLYPTRETRVSVNVRPAGGVSVSDPPIGAGWTVTARPDGRITNLADGKDYPYLFWESPDAAPPFAYREGFVVARADLAGFFRARLAELGLNAAETADFLAYWLDALPAYPWYQFYFFDQARIDREAPLDISPAPDTVIRVFFDYRGLDDPVQVAPQVLSAPARRGFTVVEWGGRKYRR
jgi:hypothetical protein